MYAFENRYHEKHFVEDFDPECDGVYCREYAENPEENEMAQSIDEHFFYYGTDLPEDFEKLRYEEKVEAMTNAIVDYYCAIESTILHF